MCGYKRTRKSLYKASNLLKYSLHEFSQIVVRLSLGPRYETLALRMFQSFKRFVYILQTDLGLLMISTQSKSL